MQVKPVTPPSSWMSTRSTDRAIRLKLPNAEGPDQSSTWEVSRPDAHVANCAPNDRVRRRRSVPRRSSAIHRKLSEPSISAGVVLLVRRPDARAARSVPITPDNRRKRRPAGYGGDPALEHTCESGRTSWAVPDGFGSSTAATVQPRRTGSTRPILSDRSRQLILDPQDSSSEHVTGQNRR